MITSHEYPTSIKEVLKLINENPKAQILAGGSDLSTNLNKSTETLIDLQNVNLNYIKSSSTGDDVEIGAMTSAYTIYTSELVPIALRKAAFHVGDMPLLHAVTIGGNCAKLYPWCDLPPMLWALNATIKLYEANGDYKEFAADEFFSYSHEKNVSRRGSFISEICIPTPPENSYSQYQKFTMTEIEKGQVNLATYIAWDDDHKIIDVRFVVGAITKVFTRLPTVESLLLHQKITDELVQQCIDSITETNLKIVPNFKSSVKYRLHILRTYIKRALNQCKEKMEEL